MRWAAGHQIKWGKQFFHSDFGNDYPVDVWEIDVTSFIQDSANLVRRAGTMLMEMFSSSEHPPSVLISPLRKNGST